METVEGIPGDKKIGDMTEEEKDRLQQKIIEIMDKQEKQVREAEATASPQ